MQKVLKNPVVVVLVVLAGLAAMATLYFHWAGYSTSIGWSLSTSSELEPIILHEVQKGPFAFELMGEKITLTESYFGDKIQSLETVTIVTFLLVWLGIGVLVAAASYFRQWGYIIFSGIFIVWLTQLKLGIFFDEGSWVVLLPLIGIIGLGYYFHAFNTEASLVLRIVSILLVEGVLSYFIWSQPVEFAYHFFGNGLVPLMLLVFVFIAIVSEEILFGLLYVLTRSKGARGNEKHWLILGGIYIVNVLGYYLNLTGLIDFGFAFLDPFVLLFVSFAFSLWSLKYKWNLVREHMAYAPFLAMILAMALVTFSLLAMALARGMDGIYEGLHYIIVYAHLGFGFMFFAYVVINFFVPLLQGLMVHKIVYKPQSFHYATARIGGLIATLAFFLLSSQLALKMFKSSGYSFLADAEHRSGNTQLAITYYKNAEFYGYNTHYPNYQLGTLFLSNGKLELAREHFRKATARYPSAQAFVNASNLQSESDLSLSNSLLDQGLNHFPGQPEIINNQGIIDYRNEWYDKAYNHFKSVNSNQSWNQAPQANRWAALAAQRKIEESDVEEVYNEGNLVVRSNVLSAHLSAGKPIEAQLDTSAVAQSQYPLHRQAYLINLSNFRADSLLQKYLKDELALADAGLKDELNKALALNAYLSGRVKSSLQRMDQIQTAKSGKAAGRVLDEMGLLLLDQHAPIEAGSFFAQAVQKGYGEAKFHLFVSLLESSHFDRAQLLLQNLIASDTTYLQMKRKLKNVFEPGADISEQAQFNALYYRARFIEPAVLSDQLQDLPKNAQARVLQKLALDLENEGANTSPYQKAGMSLPLPVLDPLSDSLLVDMARERPFDENMVIRASQVLEKREAIDAYNLLNEALSFNPNSIALLKRHAMLALEINLPEYADTSLQRLSALMESIAYAQFERAWYARKKEKEEEQQNWQLDE